MGRYLDEEALMHKFHWPMFFLDGGERSFSHEREVRFIFHDRDRWHEVRDEILQGAQDATEEAEVTRQRFLAREAICRGSAIDVPFDLQRGTLEIIFGKNMSAEQNTDFINCLSEIGCENYKTSVI
jgi:hypothetical protein